jgi:hypothetical protein
LALLVLFERIQQLRNVAGDLEFAALVVAGLGGWLSPAGRLAHLEHNFKGNSAVEVSDRGNQSRPSQQSRPEFCPMPAHRRGQNRA